MDATNSKRYVYDVFCDRMEDLVSDSGKVYVGAIANKDYSFGLRIDDRRLAFKLIRAAREKGYNAFVINAYDRQKQLGDGHYRRTYWRYINMIDKKVYRKNIAWHHYGIR
jgi:hypothetical protein